METPTDNDQDLSQLQNPYIIIFIIAATGVTAYLIRDAVSRLIIDPLIIFYWSAALFFKQFHQQSIWIALLFIGLYILLRRLIDELPENWRKEKNEEKIRKSKIEQWVQKINLAKEGELSRFKLFNELEILTLEVLSFKHHLPVRTIREQIRNGEIKVPFNFRKDDPFSLEAEASPLTTVLLRFQKPKKNLEAQILHVIKYLESQLED